MSEEVKPVRIKIPKDVFQILLQRSRAPRGPEYVFELLRTIAEQLRDLKLTAEIVGLWPGEGSSLGIVPADSWDAFADFLDLAGTCDRCYGPGYGVRSVEPLDAHFGEEHRIPPWSEDAQAAIRQLAAGIFAQAVAWGIEGLRPGDSCSRPTHKGSSCWGQLIDELDRGHTGDISWLLPLAPDVAVTLERCLRRLDRLIIHAAAKAVASDPKSPTDVFIPSPRQQRALELLDGCAMFGKELAKELGIDDEGQLNRDVTTPLKEQGLIDNDRKIGGYYRPDAPPWNAPIAKGTSLTQN